MHFQARHLRRPAGAIFTSTRQIPVPARSSGQTRPGRAPAPRRAAFFSLKPCAATAFLPAAPFLPPPGTPLASGHYVDGRWSLHAQRNSEIACTGCRPVSITGPDGTVAATTPRVSSAVSTAIDRRQQDRNFHQHPKEKP
ncbi:hypothetical protein Bxe_B1171 [Paraburkholderia xenovorans LB400]|uniref:Uncharacterized protein n=1 Tax=Paraburkholderia xenovorans (strain LB400) TaxID=266265 RepID=Q13MA4_PARXL|nr:hypothetical protein Bxe_B1171 [Paraburkholderia xenovorans LB400]